MMMTKAEIGVYGTTNDKDSKGIQTIVSAPAGNLFFFFLTIFVFVFSTIHVTSIGRDGNNSRKEE